MHPAVLVTAACFFVLFLNASHGTRLLGMSAVCVLIAGAYCWSRFGRLVRRMWVLLLVLCIVMLWQTPGTLLWPLWDGFSPTREGVLQAGEQAARLLSTVAVVAILMQRLRPAEVVVGLMGLLTPLRYLGLDTVRMAIRIQLVLDAIASPLPLEWRKALQQGSEPLSPIRVELEDGKYRFQDVALMVLIGALALGILLW